MKMIPSDPRHSSIRLHRFAQPKGSSQKPAAEREGIPLLRPPRGKPKANATPPTARPRPVPPRTIHPSAQTISNSQHLLTTNPVPTSPSSTLPHLITLSKKLLTSSTSPSQTGHLIIRIASNGVLALRRHENPIHAPPIYTHGDARVVDPTGAGNAFLGGYIAGWLETGDVGEALCWGSVASGVAVEQIGVPGALGVSGELGRRRLRVFKVRFGSGSGGGGGGGGGEV